MQYRLSVGQFKDPGQIKFNMYQQKNETPVIKKLFLLVLFLSFSTEEFIREISNNKLVSRLHDLSGSHCPLMSGTRTNRSGLHDVALTPPNRWSWFSWPHPPESSNSLAHSLT